MLLREGHTTEQVAKRLHCSERSMYRRLRRLYRLFGVNNRDELRGFRPPR
jgi:DNA-binding CsgD family transcriptional regulator